MPYYPIEVINIGKPEFHLHEEAIEKLNGIQNDFKYFLPPDRLKTWGASFVRSEYFTDDVIDRLISYRSEAKGFHPFIIGIVHAALNGTELVNLFATRRRSENIAVITTDSWEESFSPPHLSAYLAYYLVHYTMKFIAPEIESHEETRDCYFDKKIYKPDIKLSMKSGNICDQCRQMIDKKIDGISYLSLVKLIEYVKALSINETPIKIKKPSIFIGSSVEGIKVAELIQLGIHHVAECTLWSQGVFGLSMGNLENLVKASSRFDFAILVLTPDDVKIKRNIQSNTPRDNILFELGLFIGSLGREKTFIVYNRDEEIELPSDLAGVSAATFGNRADGNLEAAIGPVCTQLKRAMGVI